MQVRRPAERSLANEVSVRSTRGEPGPPEGSDEGRALGGTRPEAGAEKWEATGAYGDRGGGRK